MSVGRLLISTLLIIALLLVGVVVFRGPIAGVMIRNAMANAGLENPQAKVASLSLNKIELENVAAGPKGAETVFIENAVAEYRFGELLSSRTVQAVFIGPGRVTLAVDEEGGFTLPGVNIKRGEQQGAPSLPFSNITVTDVALDVRTPEGNAEGVLERRVRHASGRRN